MKYESSILKRLVDRYGVVGNPRYISEIIKEFIVQGKELFPELFTYQSDWLAHIDEFGLNPTYTVSYTGQSIYAPNTLERPVKSAILKGQTLVNLVKTSVYSGVQNGTCVDGDYPYKVIESIVGVGASILTRFQTIYPLSPSTVYYLKLTDVAHTNAFLVREHDNGKNLITQIHDLENKIIKFTTSELGTSDLFFYQQQLQVGAKVKYSENFIISDDVDSLYNVNDYFTGIQSVKMPVLTTTGKNLFDGELELGTFDVNGLPQTNSNCLRSKNFLSVSPNTNYVFSNDLNYTTLIFQYDKNKNLIVGGLNGNSVTTRDNTHYLKFRTAYGSVQNDFSVKYQLEKGSVATFYEPYKSNILTVNEDVMLRSNGDICDELNLLTGQLTQRIGEDGVVLSQEVVKTVALTIKDHNNQSVDHLKSFNGGTHVYTSSLEGSLTPSVDISVVTNLEETLKLCSLDGNTL